MQAGQSLDRTDSSRLSARLCLNRIDGWWDFRYAAATLKLPPKFSDTSLRRSAVPGFCKPRFLPLIAVALGYLGGILATPPAVAAANLTFAVNTTADAHDATPGDGICASSASQCTLRAALEEANAQPKGSTITVMVPAGTYILTLGSLTISGNAVTLSGAGASTTTITAKGKSQVLSVGSKAQATIGGVTLTGGNAGRQNGGGLANSGTTALNQSIVTKNAAGQGGGIWNKGTLTLNGTSVTGNSTAAGRTGTNNPAGNGGNGGGIWTSGKLVATNSSITGNTTGYGGNAPNDVPGSGGAGGGIFSSRANVTLNNTTVSGNTTGGGGNGESNTLAGNGGSGGGIWNSGTLAITGGQISSNATGPGGGDGANGVAGDGGGIWNSGNATLSGATVGSNKTGGATSLNSTTPGNGAGIWNSGSLRVTTSMITDNTAGTGGVGLTGGLGGGLYTNAGLVTVTSSTLSGNTAGIGGAGGLTGNNGQYGSPGGAGGDGGAIWASSVVTITASTLSSNSAGPGGTNGCGVTTCAYAGNGGNGGGIWSSGTVNVTNSTLTANTSGASGAISCGIDLCGYPGNPGVGGGSLESAGTTTLLYATVAANSDGLVNLGGTLNLTGVIVANSTNGPNCNGPVSELQGYNLDSGSSCAFSLGSDQSQVDPTLGGLASNGGPTQTMALLAGSPAIDHGGTAATGCPTVDQRGLPRPDETADASACDIGAYESQGLG
jgi:CSLREA domain-containing protein